MNDIVSLAFDDVFLSNRYKVCVSDSDAKGDDDDDGRGKIPMLSPQTTKSMFFFDVTKESSLPAFEKTFFSRDFFNFESDRHTSAIMGFI